MSKNVVLLISGYNDRAVISFCRFCRDKNIPFFLVAPDEGDWVNFTDYKSNVIETRESERLRIVDFHHYRERIKKETTFDRIVIIPSTEFLNRFLLDHRDELERGGFIIPLCNRELYEEISNKKSFGALCAQHGILIPKEYETIAESRIPFVAKPKRYLNSTKAVNEKPVLILNKRHFLSFRDKIKNEELYYQEFIGGESFYLLGYFSKRGGYQVYSQKNLIQQDQGLSIIAAESSSFHENPITDSFAELLTEKRFTGLIMIEVKVYNNHIYMIEANPRLWGPSQLILDAGMDLFDRFAFDNGLVDSLTRTTYTPKTKYFWRGGIIEDQAKNCVPAFHNYDRNAFFDHYAQWCRADIYMRLDTFPVFIKELEVSH